MKSPLVLSITFVVICLCSTPVESIFEDTIIELLEEFRKRMCHPIPKFGLPALDPFRISHLEYEANNYYLRDFSGSITNLHVDGLSDFIINEIKITTFPLQRFTFDLTFPLTSLNSLYTAKGSVANVVNLAGDGTAKADVDKVRILITTTLRIGITTISIRNLKITITINDIDVDLDNLIEEERVNDFFRALINELGLELLDDVWKAEQEFVETIAENAVNGILGKFTLGQIIGIIGGGGGDGPIFGPEDPPGDCKDFKQAIKE